MTHARFTKIIIFEQEILHISFTLFEKDFFSFTLFKKDFICTDKVFDRN